MIRLSLSRISPLRLETHRSGHTIADSDYFIADSIHTEFA